MNREHIQNWANELYKNNAKVASVSVIDIRPEQTPYFITKNTRATAYLISRRESLLDVITEGDDVMIPPVYVDAMPEKHLQNITNFIEIHNGNHDLSIVFRNSLELLDGKPRLECGIVLIEKLMA